MSSLNKMRTLLLMGVFLSTAGLICVACAAQSAVSAPAIKIALDIGHSIRRPGATSASGVAEFVLNRNLAQLVQANLLGAKFDAHLIGADGGMDVLQNRTKAAKEDALFVSLHHDSIPLDWMGQVADYQGFSVFVSRKNPHLAQSLACANEVGKHLIAAGFRPSRYHALPIKGQNRPYANEALGVHYFDDLIVLKTAQQAALLVEVGVIVNPADEQKVSSDIGKQQLAQAISHGVEACMQQP